MAAVKSYFDNARDVARRKAEWRQKRMEELMNPEVDEEAILAEEEEFQMFDSLLRRNWFVNDYDIIDLTWDASEEVFQRIMDNVHTYPEDVREVLCYTFKPPKFSKKTFRELSDEDMINMKKKQEEEIYKKVDEAWIQYKKEHGLSRPEGDVDTNYTDLYEELQATNKELETLKKTTPKKYVPPSARGKEEATPEVTALEKKILKLENEIVEAKKDIELEEQIWENGRKASIYQQLLDSVQ